MDQRILKASAKILGAIGMMADKAQGVDNSRPRGWGNTSEGHTFGLEPKGTSGKGRKRGRYNFDWWAQEQKDNVGHFEQIQANLEAVWEGVKKHMEQQKAEQGFPNGLSGSGVDGPAKCFGPETDLQKLYEACSEVTQRNTYPST